MWIGLGLHQDIAISEQEIVGPDKCPGQFGRLARAVLNELAPISNARIPLASIAKMLLDHLRLVAGDNKQLANTRAEQPAEDMLEDRFALDAQHRFGQLVGEFLHARAFASGKDNCFHGLT